MTMGLERFEQIIDAYGADTQRWPQAERMQAETLLASSAEAQTMVDAAARLDARLDLLGDVTPSELLIRRVRKAAPARLFGWASGTGWAAAAAAGLVLGLSLGQQVQTTSQADEALEQASAWSVDEAEYFG